jgi:hypothetical protein
MLPRHLAFARDFPTLGPELKRSRVKLRLSGGFEPVAFAGSGPKGSGQEISTLEPAPAARALPPRTGEPCRCARSISCTIAPRACEGAGTGSCDEMQLVRNCALYAIDAALNPLPICRSHGHLLVVTGMRFGTTNVIHDGACWS